MLALKNGRKAYQCMKLVYVVNNHHRQFLGSVFSVLIGGRHDATTIEATKHSRCKPNLLVSVCDTIYGNNG